MVVPIAIAAVLLAMASGNKRTGKLFPVLKKLQVRNDASGSGYFGAPRSHAGDHNGVDFLCTKGETVFAPDNGKVIRVANPYDGDSKYSGVLIDLDNGDSLKMFYMKVKPELIGRLVSRGEPIGYCQDISEKYGPPMKAHLHVEYIRGNQHMNIAPMFGKGQITS